MAYEDLTDYDYKLLYEDYKKELKETEDKLLRSDLKIVDMGNYITDASNLAKLLSEIKNEYFETSEDFHKQMLEYATKHGFEKWIGDEEDYE